MLARDNPCHGAEGIGKDLGLLTEGWAKDMSPSGAEIVGATSRRRRFSERTSFSKTVMI